MPDFIYPLESYLTVTQGFHSAHVGNDYGWNSGYPNGNNQYIIAPEAGRVVSAIDGYGNTYPNSKIYGNMVNIDHGGWFSLSGHLLTGSLLVKAGDYVKKGQRIARMGNSGYSMGQHLHFEIRKGGNSKSYAIDPMTVCRVDKTFTPDLVISPTTLYPDRILKKESAPIEYAGNPVASDTAKNQFHVTGTTLRARSNPNLGSTVYGYFNAGYYDTADTIDMRAEASNGYIWYKTPDGLWGALIEGQSAYIPAAAPAPKPDALQLAVNQAYEILKVYAK